jgi:hypothetical protein
LGAVFFAVNVFGFGEAVAEGDQQAAGFDVDGLLGIVKFFEEADDCAAFG